ncbi:MAG: GGDEF domain-containing protein [Candidatus Micrarchaeota archaeon]|nr:GGDEF domain-containing protein [Candidatus Micrarchaeota archaeon]
MVGHRHNRRNLIMKEILATDPNLSKVELWEAKDDGLRLMSRVGGTPIGSEQREFMMRTDPRIGKILGGQTVIFNGDKLSLFTSDPDDFNMREESLTTSFGNCGCWIPLGNMSRGHMDVTHMVAVEGFVNPSGSRDNEQLDYLVGMARLIWQELYTQRDEEIKNIDPLTNLWNRRFLSEVLLKMAIASIIRKRRFAASMYDIDDFKRTNDTYGHGTGDEVLGIIGSRLRSEAGGFVSRYGGEEIFLLNPGVATLSDLERHGTYLHSLFNPMVCNTEAGPLEIRASVGVVGSSIWQELREVKRFPQDFKKEIMTIMIERIDRMKEMRERCDSDLKRIRRQKKLPEKVEGPLLEYAKDWGELLITLADMAMYAVKLMGKDGVAMPFAKNGELSFRPII